MLRGLVISLLLTSIGCAPQDLTLRILPAAGFDSVDVSELKVYSADVGGELITCDQVAFEDVSDDALTGALIIGGAFDGPLRIPRVGNKLIVARGALADGTPAVAGCAEVPSGASGEVGLRMFAVPRLSFQQVENFASN